MRVYGDMDRLVSPAQSKELHEKLKVAGADSTLVVVQNWGHGFAPSDKAPEPDRKELCRMIADFFDKHLLKEK